VPQCPVAAEEDSMSRKLAAVVVIVAWLAAAAGAGDEFLRLAPTEADLAAKRQDWFGMYLNGKKVGWLHEDFGRTGEGADAKYVSSSTALVTVEAMEQTVEVNICETQEFDAAAPYALRAARSESKQAESSEIVELRRDGSGYAATVSAGGETRTMSVPSVEYTLADAMTQALWIKAGRAVGDTARVRDFNISELKADVDTFTVTALKESLVSGVRTKFYELTAKSALHGIEATATVDAEGRPISGKVGGLFEIRAEPEEQARRIEKGGDLFVMGIARIDRPIGEPMHVTKLVIDVEGEGLDKIADGPRQKVKRAADGKTVTLTLGADAGTTDTATAAEIAEALEETVDFPTKLPKVVALAAQAVGDAKTPKEKVERLVHFVSAYVQDVAVARNVSVPEIIATKKGDCSEHALLFVTLARAAGIPARQVGGLMYMGDDVKSFGGHAWDEVALDGHWVPVDPSWDETTLDAAHITLERNDTGMGHLSTLGRVAIRLDEVVPAPAPVRVR
jgi:protein-glutamine gamma-glutamyltransferase